MDTGKPVTTTKSVAWRRILLMLLVASSLIGAFLLAPVIKREMEAREAERIGRVHAEGLIPCGSYDGAFASTDSELLAQLPAVPALSITASPAFNDIESVHLVGHDLYYVLRQRPVGGLQPQPIGSRTSKVVRVSKTRLSNPIPNRLVELVEGDISHAAAEWPMGLDGITYYFDTPTGCAIAWSPDSDTRAGRIVGLFWALVARAKNDIPPKERTSDASLLKTIDALRLE